MNEIKIYFEKIKKMSNDELAKKEKKYLKSTSLFHGVSKKNINILAKEFYKKNKSFFLDEDIKNIDLLWKETLYHEEKTFLIVLSSLYYKNLNKEDIKIFKSWIEDSQTWDHVDELCIHVIGKIVLKYPELLPEIGTWSLSNHMWVRRASLLIHLSEIRTGKVSFDYLEHSCNLLILEKEFFIRKAIGWVIRELSQKDPTKAKKLILKLGAKASGLTLREAIRKFPKEEQLLIKSTIENNKHD